jgi:hypothetical protein
MDGRRNRPVVERSVRALPADFETLERLRQQDFVEERPQSGEWVLTPMLTPLWVAMGRTGK